MDISHCCKTKDLHSWCANRNFEETHCDCQCHKKKDKMDKLEELLDAFESAVLDYGYYDFDEDGNEHILKLKLELELKIKNARQAIINYVIKE